MSESNPTKSRRQVRRIERICPACQRPFMALLSEVERGGGIFCGQDCYHTSCSRPLADRFWEKVNKTDTCWLWTGGTNGTGHGTINNGRPKKTLRAHRVSWEIHFGSIPDGLEVCHNCPGGDNPSCVNPAHLWLGTHADNMRDMADKGIASNIYGENHVNAKLTWTIVRAMRERFEQGDISMTALAAEFNIHPSTTQNAVRGITWKEAINL